MEKYFKRLNTSVNPPPVTNGLQQSHNICSYYDSIGNIYYGLSPLPSYQNRTSAEGVSTMNVGASDFFVYAIGEISCPTRYFPRRLHRSIFRVV